MKKKKRKRKEIVELKVNATHFQNACFFPFDMFKQITSTLFNVIKLKQKKKELVFRQPLCDPSATCFFGFVPTCFYCFITRNNNKKGSVKIRPLTRL